MLVNVGGDARVRGEPPNEHTWDIGVLDPARTTGAEVLRIGLRAGSVATSSRVRRRWSTSAGDMHHLVDPRTGRSCGGRYATVAAVAHDAWWAEVAAKTVLIGDLTPVEYAYLDVHVLTITTDGTIHCDRALAGVAA